MRGLVPATNPLKSLHEGTGHSDLSYEQFTRSVLRNKSQGLVAKTHLTSLNLRDSLEGPKLGLCNYIFQHKWGIGLLCLFKGKWRHSGLMVSGLISRLHTFLSLSASVSLHPGV